MATKRVRDLAVISIPEQLTSLPLGAIAEAQGWASDQLPEPEKPVILGVQLARFLRDITPRLIGRHARLVGCQWHLYDTVEAVDEFVPPHDCDECREGLSNAKDFLRVNPGRYVGLADLEYDDDGF